MSTPSGTNPGPLYKPFEKLVRISIVGKEFEVPEGNIMLRAFQYLAPENVPYGRFCWNEARPSAWSSVVRIRLASWRS